MKYYYLRFLKLCTWPLSLSLGLELRMASSSKANAAINIFMCLIIDSPHHCVACEVRQHLCEVKRQPNVRILQPDHHVTVKIK